MKESSNLDPQPDKSSSEQSYKKGILVFRDGLREVIRDGDTIHLYYRNGVYDTSEKVTLVQKDDTLEVYDFSGNKIATEEVTPAQE